MTVSPNTISSPNDVTLTYCPECGKLLKEQEIQDDSLCVMCHRNIRPRF